jgi:hypothetical protein
MIMYMERFVDFHKNSIKPKEACLLNENKATAVMRLKGL